MTKNEFMKRIEMAHYKLDKDYLYRGCCEILGACNAYGSLSEMLRPRDLGGVNLWGINGRSDYWLGNFTKENMPIRHHFIDTFAGIVLADKGYKDLFGYYINKGWLK